jgi:tripartite-type tricarboxylate transporter receptor subunit TctC
MDWTHALRGAALTAVAAAVLGTCSASAQTWPSRPVTVIVPFTAGTTADILARGLTQYLSETLGQSFVVDNRGGAAGNIGAAAAARAPQDGYTLLLATTGQAANNKLMYQNLGFDPERDFAPVVLVGKSPVLITARADAPFSTLKELVDYARANPDKINSGSPGNGTLGHITGILLQSTAGIKFGAAVQYPRRPCHHYRPDRQEHRHRLRLDGSLRLDHPGWPDQGAGDGGCAAVAETPQCGDRIGVRPSGF